MSKEAVKKFYALSEKDLGLKAELLDMDKKYGKNDITRATLPSLIKKEVIPIAKKRGLVFSVEEFIECLEEKKSKLGKEDLLEVSGGLSPKQAALGLSGVLLLSVGAGIGSQFIARAIDKYQQQRIEQKVDIEKKSQRHKLYTKEKKEKVLEGQEGEKKGESEGNFKNKKSNPNIKWV
ncbi:MAG: hypothetical protein RUMPE_00738 [Eubacteriales bacterium SKADARSKE-1]|nr:hypothetical protein [Eubacteriales bacterium SKADARSKE-1]